MRIFLVLTLFLVQSVFAENVDNYLQLKVLENSLEDKISQTLNHFVSSQNSVNITIKTKKQRIKKEGIKTIKNDLALPGIYDRTQEVQFDTKTKEYFVVENKIAQIVVSIDLPLSASEKDVARAKKIAYTKGDLDKHRGDKVYVSKKVFLQNTLLSATHDANKTAKLTHKVEQLQKALKQVTTAYASRIEALEKEKKARDAKLDKNDIQLLTKLDKNDIKRLEHIAKENKVFMDTLRQELTQKIVDINQTLGKKGLQSFEVLNAQLTTLNGFIKKIKIKQNLDQKHVKGLQTAFDTKLERILGDVNTNFTLIQEKLRDFQKELQNSESERLTNEVIPAVPDVQTMDASTQEAFLHLVEQNKKAIIKVKREASKEIAQLQTVFQKWVLMLLVAFLSLSYIIYYFSSNTKK